MLVMSACTTQYQATNYDDVYYSPKNQPQVAKHALVVNTPETGANAYDQNEQNQAETNTYPDTTNYAQDQQYAADTNANTGYNPDDYYDYAYSARIRRFYDPYAYNSYYNDYYTNSFWYDPSPWNFGTSIYMGYNWWGPSYSFGYNPWYMNPYYGYGFGYDYGYGYGLGYGYGGYGNGYYNGYWNGYYDGNYYNSYDYNSFYYGHRNSVGSTSGIAHNNLKSSDKTFGERYEGSVYGGRSGVKSSIVNGVNEGRNSVTSPTRGISNTDGTKSSLTRGTTVPQDARNGATRTTESTITRAQNSENSLIPNRTDPTNTTIQRNGTTTQRPAAPPQRQYQYISPNRSNQNTNSQNRTNVNPNNGRSTQSYTSPEYNRPRSGQEYTSPKYRSSQPSGTNNNTRVTTPANNNNRTYARPASNTRSNENYQAPRNNTNSQPARSNSYSAPQRSSSPAPSRTSESYTPSRSSESYTPSRSSSSGSSGNSSSGSSRSSSSGSGSGSSSGGHRK